MTLAGWITMTISIGSVLTLTAWCFTRVFRSSGDKGESAIELITPDMEEYTDDDN